MAIRYTDKLNTRIRRDVKNFNAKRKALFNKGVTSALLPPKVSTKELRAGFTNRRELMDRLRELETFSAAGKVYRSAGGVKGTENLFRYVQTSGKKSGRKIEKRAESLKYSGNVEYPVMLNEAILNLQTKTKFLYQDVKMLSADQLRTYRTTTGKPEADNPKLQRFYENFYKMMLQEAAKVGVDPDILIKLVDQFKQLTPEELLQAYRANPEFKNVKEYSDTPKSNRGSIIDDETLTNMLKTLSERMPEIIQDIRANGLK